MKYLLITLAILAGLYGCVWLFNHINAWIGIFTVIFFIAFLIQQLFKTKTK